MLFPPSFPLPLPLPLLLLLSPTSVPFSHRTCTFRRHSPQALSRSRHLPNCHRFFILLRCLPSPPLTSSTSRLFHASLLCSPRCSSCTSPEHSKNLSADVRRWGQFLHHIANPKHPFHKFTTGPPCPRPEQGATTRAQRGQRQQTARERGTVKGIGRHSSGDGAMKREQRGEIN